MIVQYRVLGRWGCNPSNGFRLKICLFFWWLNLSSNNAFEYNIHKLIFKTVWFQPASKRWPSASKTNMIINTPWNLKFMIARRCFLHFFGLLCELAMWSNHFDTFFSWAATKQFVGPAHLEDSAPSSVLMTSHPFFLYPFFPGLAFFSCVTVLWKLTQIEQVDSLRFRIAKFRFVMSDFQKNPIFFLSEIKPGHSEIQAFVVSSWLWNT